MMGKHTKREEEIQPVEGIRIYVIEHPEWFWSTNFFNGVYKLHEEK